MYLASCSTDLSIKLWDVKDSYGCVRTLRGHDHTVSDVKFVPPNVGAVYLSGGEKTVVGGGGGVDAGGAQAKFVVTASRDGTIKFWDLETGFCDATISDHGDWVRCLAVRGARGSVGNSSKEEGASEENASVDSLVLVASSGNDRTIYVYNAYDKREKVAELRGHDHVLEALSFLCSSALPQEKKTAPTSRSKANTPNTWDYLASASRDRTVRLWSVSNGGSCLMTFRAHENWVRGVMVHPSGNYVLSCGDDRSIRVFDIKVSVWSCWNFCHAKYIIC
jgi:platelet-activating factor acetylhydrolase IB subunit alpha